MPLGVLVFPTTTGQAVFENPLVHGSLSTSGKASYRNLRGSLSQSRRQPIPIPQQQPTRVILDRVLRSMRLMGGEEFQILRAVVIPNPVLVMNDFSRFKVAAQNALHDQSVFRHMTLMGKRVIRGICESVSPRHVSLPFPVGLRGVTTSPPFYAVIPNPLAHGHERAADLGRNLVHAPSLFDISSSHPVGVRKVRKVRFHAPNYITTRKVGR